MKVSIAHIMLAFLLRGIWTCDFADAADRPKRTPDGRVLESTFSDLIRLPTPSILDRETLEASRTFIANGNAVFRELYWPSSSGAKVVPQDTSSLADLPTPRTNFFNLASLIGDEGKSSSTDPIKAEAARWRFVAQVRLFLSAKYIVPSIFDTARALKDIPIPPIEWWPHPVMADKVVSRFSKEGRWFEIQDDGLVLSALIVNDAGVMDISDGGAIASTIIEYLNVSADERDRVKVAFAKVDSFVFGTFTIPVDLPQAIANTSSEGKASDWRSFFASSFCSDGKFLFLRFMEAEHSEYGYLRVDYPDRF